LRMGPSSSRIVSFDCKCAPYGVDISGCRSNASTLRHDAKDFAPLEKSVLCLCSDMLQLKVLHCLHLFAGYVSSHRLFEISDLRKGQYARQGLCVYFSQRTVVGAERMHFGPNAVHVDYNRYFRFFEAFNLFVSPRSSDIWCLHLLAKQIISTGNLGKMEELVTESSLKVE
jgi:hypothetical protein